MGYYTQYDVQLFGIDNANQAVKIAEEFELDDYEVFSDGTKLSSYFNSKWYDWKENTLKISRNYPRVLFVITGIGEDYDDIWKARVRNGICEIVKAKIVFDEFTLI